MKNLVISGLLIVVYFIFEVEILLTPNFGDFSNILVRNEDILIVIIVVNLFEYIKLLKKKNV